jgi:hypothetical protein
MTVEEQLARLTGIVDSLASSVVAHDNQIENLIKVAEKHEAIWRDMQKQWQAYINTLPKN